MKLLRYGPPGREKPGLLDAEGRVRDLSGKVEDIAGEVLSPAGLAKLAALDPAGLPQVKGSPRIGPCVGNVPKLVCVGLNYADHAAETGAKSPPEPILFQKATTCITGPNDDVMMPRGSKKTDWEVELGVIIGTTARYVPEEKSLDYVAGYCVFNDVSEREYQLKKGGSQWSKGKGCDTFGPIGPWLVTTDEIRDPQNLDMWLKVNGARRQTGNTRTMIFGVAALVSDLSKCMTLLPGDVITTGTPPGVGMGMKPEPQYLKPGDVVTLGIKGLGEQRQEVIAFRK